MAAVDALYRTEDDRYFATDGLCTHEQVELADGFVSGTIIECPMHTAASTSPPAKPRARRPASISSLIR